MPCCIAGEVRDERQGEDRRHRRGRGPHHGPDLHDRGADGHERSPEHGDQELGGGDRQEPGGVGQGDGDPREAAFGVQRRGEGPALSWI